MSLLGHFWPANRQSRQVVQSQFIRSDIGLNLQIRILAILEKKLLLNMNFFRKVILAT